MYGNYGWTSKKKSPKSNSKLRKVAEEAARNGAKFIKEEFFEKGLESVVEKGQGDFFLIDDLQRNFFYNGVIYTGNRYKTTRERKFWENNLIV